MRTGHVFIRLGPSEDRLYISEQGSPKTRQRLHFPPILVGLLGIRLNLVVLRADTSLSDGGMWDVEAQAWPGLWGSREPPWTEDALSLLWNSLLDLFIRVYTESSPASASPVFRDLCSGRVVGKKFRMGSRKLLEPRSSACSRKCVDQCSS